MKLFSVLLVSAFALAQNASDGFVVNDFRATKAIRLVNDAKRHKNFLRLTPAKMNQTGAAWTMEQQPVGEGFETSFRFQLSEAAANEYGGADGFAFVIQSLGTEAIAGRGAAGGFALARGANNPEKRGIPRSLAVFFDTFRNEDEEDPSSNYSAVFTNGDGYWLPRRLAVSDELRVKLKDGQVHEVRIVYQRPQLMVYLDQNADAVLTLAVDLASVVGAEGKGYVGFTAATGSGYQNHDILSWSFRPGAAIVSSSIQFMNQACLPNRTLCTPDAAVVEARGDGRYLVILPANLEWGASIANPDGREVKIRSLRGTVCWNVSAKRNHSCNDAEGDRSNSGAGLVSESGVPGGLVMQHRNGRTYFSVNATKGGFEKNEGYFEFEVEVAGNS